MRSNAEMICDRDRADLRRIRRHRERESMTDDEIDRRMVKAIIAAAPNGELSARDFQRVNIPTAETTNAARIKRCFVIALAKDPAVANLKAINTW
jgi:hypothetical protein